MGAENSWIFVEFALNITLTLGVLYLLFDACPKYQFHAAPRQIHFKAATSIVINNVSSKHQ